MEENYSATPRSVMLKVISIILIPVSAFSLLICFANCSIISRYEVSNPTLTFSVFIGFFASAFGIFAAAFGLSSWKRPDRRESCIVIGVILLISVILTNILMAIGAGSAMYLFMIFTGSVPSVLYMIGASKLEKTSIPH